MNESLANRNIDGCEMVSASDSPAVSMLWRHKGDGANHLTS